MFRSTLCRLQTVFYLLKLKVQLILYKIVSKLLTISNGTNYLYYYNSTVCTI
jgi:hypothetical protein